MTTEIEHEQDSSTGALLLNSDNLAQMQRAAELMASAKVTVPKHLTGSPGDCLAVIMQAMQWHMNPFAVAQKTYIVNGQLGYEAQLVNAAVSSSKLLSSRIDYEWEGDWKAVNGKSDKSDDRAVAVSATLRGEAKPRRLRVSMAQAGVRNSPNWESDPRQQLAYLATKKWARLHAPDVMLGVYTPDELQDMPTERHMGQADEVMPDAPALADNSRAGKVKAALAARKASAPPQPAAALADVMAAIGSASTIDALKATAELAGSLASDDDRKTARDAYKARGAELKAAAAVDQETGEILPPAGFDMAAATEMMKSCTSIETLTELMAEFKDAPAQAQPLLQEAFIERHRELEQKP